MADTRAPSITRRSDLLLLLTLFVVTFEKIRWEQGVSVTLADIVTLIYLVSFAADRLTARDWRMPRSSVVVLGFTALFLVVFLAGLFNIETTQGLEQFGKGMAKLVIHLLFLACAVAHMARRSPRFYLTSMAAFFAGMTFNAAYGIVQLAAARAGVNLDEILLSPLTGGASSINIYGAVGGESVYRPNALTGDPNHLGVMLAIPVLVLTPLYLRLPRGSRLRTPLAALIGFLVIVELATLSRSGILAIAAGLVVLAFPYHRLLATPRFIVPLSAVAVTVLAIVVQRRDYFMTVLESRLSTGGPESNRWEIYGMVPDVLQTHPLLGLGLNNFSVYYEFITGKTNWGPHSFYVSLIVEGGIAGTVAFGLFLWYLFRRLGVARQVGRLLIGAGQELGHLVAPIGWGLTAALVGTMAANLFYLTMSFYYFFAFAVLAVALPLVAQTRLRFPR